MTQNSGHITPGDPAGYTVRSGDTLSGIAQRAHGNGSKAYWMTLYVAHQVTIGINPNIIRPGENLSIPAINHNPYADSLYIVKPGDTLFGIAERVENGQEKAISYCV
jgi:nucleoid-associated protein YgaU